MLRSQLWILAHSGALGGLIGFLESRAASWPMLKPWAVSSLILEPWAASWLILELWVGMHPEFDKLLNGLWQWLAFGLVTDFIVFIAH